MTRYFEGASLNQAAKIDIRIVQGERLQLHSGIKHLGFIFSALWLALTLVAGADFTQTLTPEKILAAGLGKLTPAEREQLDRFVREYMAAAPAPATTPDSPPPAAGPPNSSVATSVASLPNSSNTMPAWVGALEQQEQTKKKPGKSEVMESRLRGDFSGWSGRSTFRLENGQLWKQAGQDTYQFAPTLKSPKVKITPAALGSFWLEIEGVYQRCRVLPVKM